MSLYIAIYAYLLLLALACSFCLTIVARRCALRWGVLDQPGERKMHHAPIPVMGGAAIFGAFALVAGLNAALLVLLPLEEWGLGWLSREILAFLQPDAGLKLAGLITGAVIITGLGAVDDIWMLGPWTKLAGQVAAASILVACGMQVNLFIPYPAVTALITVLWVVTMVNAMNFLDNMDGLAGGVSVIAALSFFLCVAPQGDLFLSVLLMIFAGAAAGFLWHNLHPARIFMGDTGSMFCGYFLATAPILATFYTPGSPSRVAVAAPLLALSVPIFDIVSVVYIRWRNGESIMKGDKRHFSHRLVELGMSPRQAVEFIFLVAAICGLGAALLPQIAVSGTLIILAQTTGIFLLIVLLMNANNRSADPNP